LNKSNKKDKIPEKNPELTDESVARLNAMENKLNKNLNNLDLNRNKPKPVEKKSNTNDIQFDGDFILENQRAAAQKQELEEFDNLYDNIFDGHNYPEDPRPENNDEITYENKKRTFNEAFDKDEKGANDEEKVFGEKKFKAV